MGYSCSTRRSIGTDVKVSTYRPHELENLAIEEFRRVYDSHEKACCVGDGWSLRVTNHGVSLVMHYSLKDKATRVWTTHESSVAL